MTDQYTSKMVELTSKRKKMLDEGEAFLKVKRIELGVAKYFNLSVLISPEARVNATETLKQYLDHLTVEKKFYIEYHKTFLTEIIEISHLLTSKEKDRLLPHAINGLEENNVIRINVNQNKALVVTKIQRVIDLFDSNQITDDDLKAGVIGLDSYQDVEELESLMGEIETLDKETEELATLQKKRHIIGQNFIANFLNHFNNS